MFGKFLTMAAIMESSEGSRFLDETCPTLEYARSDSITDKEYEELEDRVYKWWSNCEDVTYSTETAENIECGREGNYLQCRLFQNMHLGAYFVNQWSEAKTCGCEYDTSTFHYLPDDQKTCVCKVNVHLRTGFREHKSDDSTCHDPNDTTTTTTAPTTTTLPDF